MSFPTSNNLPACALVIDEDEKYFSCHAFQYLKQNLNSKSAIAVVIAELLKTQICALNEEFLGGPRVYNAPVAQIFQDNMDHRELEE